MAPEEGPGPAPILVGGAARLAEKLDDEEAALAHALAQLQVKRRQRK